MVPRQFLQFLLHKGRFSKHRLPSTRDLHNKCLHIYGRKQNFVHLSRTDPDLFHKVCHKQLDLQSKALLVGCYCPCSKQIYLCSSLIGSKLNKPGHFHLQLTYLAVSQTFLCTPDQYRALLMRLHGDFQKQEFQPIDTARVKICEA